MAFSRSAVYISDLFDDATVTQSYLVTTVPLSAGFLWSFARQWDFDLDYTADFIGESNGAYNHELTFDFKLFW